MIHFRIHSTTIQLTTAQTTLKHRSASHFGDLGITTTTTISNDDDGVKSTSVSTNDVKGSKNDSLELPSSMQLGFKDRFVSPTPVRFSFILFWTPTTVQVVAMGSPILMNSPPGYTRSTPAGNIESFIALVGWRFAFRYLPKNFWIYVFEFSWIL